MSETHTATLGAILSVTTGVLVAPLDETFALQDFLVGRSLMTHERVLKADEQTQALLEQFPRLAEATAPDFSAVPRDRVEQACRDWVASVAEHVGWTEAEVRPVTGCEVSVGEGLDYLLNTLGRDR